MTPLVVVQEFDLFLKDKNLSFEAVVIGGAALSILGIISRQTQDIDVLDPDIPKEIHLASVEFAQKNKIEKTFLKENWLNHGPESLRKYLRKDWRKRLQPLWQGQSITLQTLGRVDLIGTKVLAYCDRGQDYKDCLDMKPTREELLEITPWVKDYDANPKWASYVQDQVEYLMQGLGYEL